MTAKSCNTCGRGFEGESDFLFGTSRWRLCSQDNLWFNCSCGSTLMLRKGKFDWYSPERFLGEEARGVFNRLGNLRDLPHLPTGVMELQQALQDPSISPKIAAKALRDEPVIGAHVLKIAESLRFTRNPSNPPIRSLEHAIVYVGYRTLSDLLVTSALRSFQLPSSDFDHEAYWNESYVRGVLAEAVMKRIDLKLNPDEVYLAGTLSDVGKLAMAFCFPPIATKIARDMHNVGALSTWRQSETAYRFPDHSILGEIAASLWGMPDFVMDAARHHHSVPDVKKKTPLNLTELVAVAAQLTHWALLQPHRIENDVLEAFKVRAGLGQAELDLLASDLTKLGKDVISGLRAA